MPGVPYRFVGGNVDPGEGLIDALYREVMEESGLTNLSIVKKLGVQRYYKPFIDANVERHDYLLISNQILPDYWEHTGTGEGGDNGDVFNYQWITIDEIDLIDEEYQLQIRDEYRTDIFGG